MDGDTRTITVTDRAGGQPVTAEIRREGPRHHFSVINSRNGRLLGTVAQQQAGWEAYSTPEAFRGSGTTAGAADLGPARMEVPDRLWGGDRQRAVIATAGTDEAAVWYLVDWLVEHRAPAIGYGPHPDVTPRRMYDRFEVADYDGSAPFAVIHCINDDPPEDTEVLVSHPELADLCESIRRYEQANGLRNNAGRP